MTNVDIMEAFEPVFHNLLIEQEKILQEHFNTGE